MPSPSVQPAAQGRDAPAARRNGEAVFAALRRFLPPSGTVLEIGSGTGQHAALFAPRIAPLRWQPSDPDPAALASIRAWAATVSADPPLAPLRLDVRDGDWRLPAGHDTRMIFAANVLHIAPWPVTVSLLAGAGRILPADGLLFLYGPFRRAGAHTAPGNAAFDAALRRQNPDWGVRDLDRIATIAAAGHGLRLDEVVEMPVNNLSAVFRRIRDPAPAE